MKNPTLARLDHILAPVERKTAGLKRVKKGYWAYRNMMWKFGQSIAKHDVVWNRFKEQLEKPERIYSNPIQWRIYGVDFPVFVKPDLAPRVTTC